MTQPKYKNRLAEYTGATKDIHFQKSCATNTLAHKSDNTTVPLKTLLPSQVEYIGGLWRVQDRFPHTVQMVRNQELVLAERLAHTERIPFEYYRAYRIGENCYGKYLFSNPDVIVAKYTTDDGVYWGYGNTIEQARAFLGIRLFDQYMDLIHATACRGAQINQKK